MNNRVAENICFGLSFGKLRKSARAA